jgi:hypothetical protein
MPWRLRARGDRIENADRLDSENSRSRTIAERECHLLSLELEQLQESATNAAKWEINSKDPEKATRITGSNGTKQN